VIWVLTEFDVDFESVEKSAKKIMKEKVTENGFCFFITVRKIFWLKTFCL
jgi:hypothetical protein